MRLPRIKLRTRIFLGYGTLIGLLLGVSALGGLGLSSIGDEVDKMDGIAGNANRLNELAVRLEVVRRGISEFRADADPASLKDVPEAEKRATFLLQQAAEFTLSEQRRAMFNGMQGKLRDFIPKRERFVQLRAGTVGQRQALTAAGDTANLAIQALPQPEAIPARIAWLAAVGTCDRFLETHASAAASACQSSIAVATRAVAEISVPDATAALQGYAAVFADLAPALIESDSLYEEQLRPVIQEIAATSAKGLDRLMAGFNSTSQKAIANAEATLAQELWLSGAAVLIGLVLAALIARSIIRPIKVMTAAMTGLASGDRTCAVPDSDRRDEMGQMAQAVEVFRRHAIENDELMKERERSRVETEQRQRGLNLATEDFAKSISGAMDEFLTQAGLMRECAGSVTGGAHRTREKMQGTAEEASAASRDLNSVAAAAEEMATSITEISRQIGAVTESVQSAVTKASETDAKVAGLSVAADRIGDVVGMINSIAGQTNLLALNATIEAARAGEAGKGFAVVAGEVKVLAAQTAKATEQIGSQILAIRDATGQAVIAVRDVVAAISQIETIAHVISDAVSQQANATQEITMSVQTVTTTTATAAGAMQDVLGIVDETDLNSKQVSGAADKMRGSAEQIRAEMLNFLNAVTEGGEKERRLYQRIPGAGTDAEVRIAGYPVVSGMIRNISRGGLDIEVCCEAKPGTQLEVTLPDGGIVAARIARNTGASIGVSMRQDAGSLRRIDAALAHIQALNQAMAA